MVAPNFKDEADIQSRLLEIIQKDELSGLIIDDAMIAEYKAHQEDVFPQFSIDHISRKAALKAGQEVLKSFDMLEVLTSDLNISITAHELLRPDIVCINPERECIVLFELKNAAQTGRQALTELLAYEHELKNLLPFLSNYDVCHVLISSEWSTLMDHAASSAITWSNRNLLCLEAALHENKLQLKTRIPSTWKITGSVYFPEEALATVTLCLYEKDAYSDDFDKSQEKELDHRVWTSMEVMAREGDRIGANGFCLLWKDCSNISLTRYNITVCGISPYAFYKLSRIKGQIQEFDGRLVERLDEYICDNDPQGHSESLMRIATAAYPLLQEVSDPTLEGFSYWSSERISLARRSEPLLCEFWGSLGDYARQYILHPAIRKHRRNTLSNGLGDWRFPNVALPIINSFTQPEIFRDGDVRCSDAFKLGYFLGLDRSLRLNIKSGNNNSTLNCMFAWNRIELMAVIDEMQLLASSAENVNPPESPLKFHGDPLADDQEDFDAFMTWVLIEFFQSSPVHALFLHIGYNGAFAFEEQKQGLWAKPFQSQYLAGIEKEIENATRLVLAIYRSLYDEAGLYGELELHYQSLCKALGLRRNFSKKKEVGLDTSKLVPVWQAILDASDYVLEPVFYKLAPVSYSNVDWEWFRQGVTEMRQRGIHDAGVILLPNGQLVTGPVMPSEVKIPLSIDPSKSEVPFLDRSHGFGFVRVTTWDALKSGEIFAR